MKKRLLVVSAVLGTTALGSTTILAGTTFKKQTAQPVYTNDLFADQGPLYFSPQEPKATDAVHLTLRARHNNLTNANVVIINQRTGKSATIPMKRAGSDKNGLYDFWIGTIPASGDNESYYFMAKSGKATAYYNGSGTYTGVPTSGNFLISPGFTTPTYAQNAVMYQIFVDRFANGNASNDVKTGEYSVDGVPTVHLKWGQDPEVMGAQDSLAFAGGDLQGVDSKLSYLTKTLGVNMLFLSPIFTSPTNHKYDITDYFNVDPHFGGNTAFEKLSKDIHSTTDKFGDPGKVILDGVFNHTSVQNPWFQDAFDKGTKSPYYGWYTFHTWPTDYATFMGVQSMPKLNYASTSLRGEIYANPDSVAQTWLKAPYSADGWRLDAPSHVAANGTDPDVAGLQNDTVNHQVWQGFRTAVKGVNSSDFIFGEYLNDMTATPWLSGKEWDGSVNYAGFENPVGEWITMYDYNNNGKPISTSTFAQIIRDDLNAVPRAAQLVQVNQIDNHDSTRFAERASANPTYKNYKSPDGSTASLEYGGTPDVWKDYLGAIMQLTFTGLPTLYYGDEYGMMGGDSNDPGKRWTFDWSKVAHGGNSVFKVYQQLIALRHQHSALRDGSFMELTADDSSNVFAFARFDAKERMIIALNSSNQTQTLTIPASEAGVFKNSILKNLTPQTAGYKASAKYKADAHGNIRVTLHPEYGLILTQNGGKLY